MILHPTERCILWRLNDAGRAVDIVSMRLHVKSDQRTFEQSIVGLIGHGLIKQDYFGLWITNAGRNELYDANERDVLKALR